MQHFDLVIIGTGSGNSIPGPVNEHQRIAIVEAGSFGGTCLNAGCIPTKMFVHPAELADAARHGRDLNVRAHLDTVDWAGMRDRIFGRIDAIEAGGREYRTGERTPNITVFAGHGTFSGHKKLEIALHDGGTETITADTFVIAAGSSAVVPDVPGLADVTHHTSDSVMRIDDLPRRVIIVGGGYIAAEFGHVFSSFGSEVTQVVRGPRLLRDHDLDVSAALTSSVSARYELLLNTTLAAASQSGAEITLTVDTPSGPRDLKGDLLLFATGRRPNGRALKAERTGLELEADGRIRVDAYQRTGVDGIWALGDVSSPYQLKHVANHEAKVVAHNLQHPDHLRATDHRFVPSAVFTDPQIATVGRTEQELKDEGVQYISKTQAYGDIAAGWAREDRTNFLKVLADPTTGLLLGAHVIGPEAATVIQPIIQAMHFGQSAQDIAKGQYWIHPALPELVENALLGLELPASA